MTTSAKGLSPVAIPNPASARSSVNGAGIHFRPLTLSNDPNRDAEISLNIRLQWGLAAFVFWGAMRPNYPHKPMNPQGHEPHKYPTPTTPQAPETPLAANSTSRQADEASKN